MRTLVRLLAVAIAAPAVVTRPAIPLRPSSVHTIDAPDAVVTRLRELVEADGGVIAAGDEHVVARFVRRARWFPYRTVEKVAFRPDEVTFDHLRGPFHRCTERFRVEPAPDGGSVVTHEGSFVMRGGLPGWLLGVVVVRRAFEDHVAAHLARHLS